MIPAGQRSAGAASNQYQILGHLATGGMAELYLARSVGIAGFERHVVLKRIMAEHARNHRFVTMFLDEARLAAQLHHPNIAQVYDIGRVGESYFFTMEYVHGENVRDLLQRVAALKRQIPIEVTLTIIAGAAAGLHYAHEKRGLDRSPLGIVHRDVSPSNLMVAYQGAVKLVDFGIAKASHRMTETRSGAVKGKVAYMSPEQCTGHPLDRRSDVFSLGVVCFEMATMTRLYKYPTDFETMSNIVNQPPPAPSSRRADLPRELDHIIQKALSKRPEDRYQTAGEMLEAIEQFASRERLALSPMAMSRYIRDLFGERPEPWYELEAAGEHTGLVTVETAAVDPQAVTPDPFSVNSTHKTWAAPRRQLPGDWGADDDGVVGGPTPVTGMPPPGMAAAIAASTLSSPATAPARRPHTPTGPEPIVHVHTTLTGHGPPPQPVRPSVRLAAVATTPPSEDTSGQGTYVGAPSEAPLVVAEVPVVRATPDHDPSWGDPADGSWGGPNSAAELALPRRRRTGLWVAMFAAVVIGGAAILLAGGGDGGAAKVPAGPQPAAPPAPSQTRDDAPAPTPPTDEVAPPSADPAPAPTPPTDEVATEPAPAPAPAPPTPPTTDASTSPAAKSQRPSGKRPPRTKPKTPPSATTPAPARKCGDPYGIYPPCG